ncbi:hypothetical protein J5X84_09120 [Streptosporangiaceae bacterium NEAU-GS5]|nr:hypothetical protein [Streptosporangiaceae bacterium NEAU-GS5]
MLIVVVKDAVPDAVTDGGNEAVGGSTAVGGSAAAAASAAPAAAAELAAVVGTVAVVAESREAGAWGEELFAGPQAAHAIHAMPDTHAMITWNALVIRAVRALVMPITLRHITCTQRFRS